MLFISLTCSRNNCYYFLLTLSYRKTMNLPFPTDKFFDEVLTIFFPFFFKEAANKKSWKNWKSGKRWKSWTNWKSGKRWKSWTNWKSWKRWKSWKPLKKLKTLKELKKSERAEKGERDKKAEKPWNCHKFQKLFIFIYYDFRTYFKS